MEQWLWLALRDGLLVVRPDGSHDFLRVDGPLITNVAFSAKATMSHTSQNLR